MIVREMREIDCYAVLNRQCIGRLATCAKYQPYVVPVQYAFSEGLIYSFSLPGRKVENMRENPKVCLLVDELQNSQHWKSVAIEGTFRELPSTEGRQEAWEILQRRNDWWEPGALKPTPSNTIVGSSPHLFYTIWIDRMSGRQTAED
jgi:nitroimidazol reductase NimA-like FMN-containing flavoprotein (pyridoxamine 5'-phosphate oxidase superfamily)